MRQNRKSDEIRDLSIEVGILSYAEGSARIKQGKTQIICSASVDENIPKWLKEKNQGWVTAEYNLLPRSTELRVTRKKALYSGRSQEISRLIGRSLRAAVDLEKLGPRQILIDCDVIEADGGTRTACVSASFVALALCLNHLKSKNLIQEICLKHYLCGLSAGIVQGNCLVDLDYKEDLAADVDLNIVLNNKNELVESQATAEGNLFSQDDLNQMIDLVKKNASKIFEEQSKHIASFFPLK